VGVFSSLLWPLKRVEIDQLKLLDHCDLNINFLKTRVGVEIGGYGFGLYYNKGAKQARAKMDNYSDKAWIM